MAAPDFAMNAEREVMTRKLWAAPGAYDGEERSKVLDWLGFDSQIVFDSFIRSHLQDAIDGGDADLAYGLARAHNRALVDFCSADRRLLPMGYLPLMDIDRSVAFATEAIATGCAGLEIPTSSPVGHSPSHVGLDSLYAQAAEARVPIMFHLGGRRELDDNYNKNGLPREPAFHGGDGPMRSLEYATGFHRVTTTVSVLVIDGVLDRHPDLRVGVIEFGATWLPGFMKFLDSTMEAFRKNEGRLQRLSLGLSDYIRRQVRVAALCHDDVAWVIRECGPDVVMFSSDYPHIEGGRNPLGRFERNLDAGEVEDHARDRFFSGNYADLMGKVEC
jgi:predicted TIM-barrel fold metal-dependent hydrolase